MNNFVSMKIGKSCLYNRLFPKKKLYGEGMISKWH